MKEKVEQLDRAFKMYHHLRHELINEKFKEYGLHSCQPPILKYLSDHKDATQKEIADSLNISQPAVAKSLKKMEEAGLIVRLENKKDTRCHKLKLTKKGMEIVDFAEDYFMALDGITYTDFTEDEIELLSSFVNNMTENLRKFSKKGDTNV